MTQTLTVYDAVRHVHSFFPYYNVTDARIFFSPPARPAQRGGGAPPSGGGRLCTVARAIAHRATTRPDADPSQPSSERSVILILRKTPTHKHT